jgi:hypothetical protein
MSSLSMSLDDTNYAQLVELARAMLPEYAPTWTDHNVHDPGITLLELLAWVADQQIYALGRERRDERLGYAALLGVRPYGPVPARGLLWPAANVTASQPSGPAGTLVPRNATATARRDQSPAFMVEHSVYLTRARIKAMRTVRPGGQTVAHPFDAGNPKRPPFAPFGDNPERGTMLEIELSDRLLDDKRDEKARYLLPIGVFCSTNNETELRAQRVAPERRRLQARLVWREEKGGDIETALPIVHDETDGFLRSGVLIVDLTSLPSSFVAEQASKLRLLLRADLPLPPQLAALALNVVPVRQQTMEMFPRDDRWNSTGLPGQTFRLEDETIPLEPRDGGLTVTVQSKPWDQCKDFASAGPDDRVFAFDLANRTIQFGNGVNGKIPPFGAVVAVSCKTCAGMAGNLPANVSWQVPVSLAESFVNLEAMRGGTDRVDLIGLRRESRSRVGTRRPLVTDADLVNAALACRDLAVARAQVLPGFDSECRTGSAGRGRTLVAVRGAGRADPAVVPESQAWLRALRRRLAPRLPLGDRVTIVAPRYCQVRLHATLRVAQNRNGADIVAKAKRLLTTRFSAVEACPGDVAWQLGRDVRANDIQGWLLRLPGVVAVSDARVGKGTGLPAADKVKLPRDGLPQLQIEPDDVAIEPVARGAHA